MSMPPSNRYTPTWFAAFLDSIPAEQTERETLGLARWLPLPAFRSVLDVACGSGRIARHLDRLGYRVTGIDRDRDAIARAAASVPRGCFICLDQRALDRLEGPFDAAVVVWQSFGYFDRAGNDEVLRQLARLLRPGGRLALDVYHPAAIARQQGRRPDPRSGVAAITNTLIGSRLRSEIEYEGGMVERMDFELFLPEELAARAAPFDLSVLGACCWWEPDRPPDPDVPRYQVIFERGQTLDPPATSA